MASATKLTRKRKMSFDQFLTHLRALKGTFVVTPGHALRIPGGVCPVSAVCNRLKGTTYTSSVNNPALDMGMSRRLARQIADAADQQSRTLPPLKRNYRNRMLRALKLREGV